MKRLITKRNAFTLVELLIVIALIAILSVAVLATINPIEQANKATDASVQNDAAEVMNGYERMYANSQTYPWMKYGPTLSKPTVEDAQLIRSDQVGFGICNATDATFLVDATTPSSACTTDSIDPGLLVSQDELKTAFVGKNEFQNPGAKGENSLYLFKEGASGGSVYVCYVPKAKSNRSSATNTLWCLVNGEVPTRVKAGIGSAGGCTAPATTDSAWGNATTALANGDAPKAAIFKCVP